MNQARKKKKSKKNDNNHKSKRKLICTVWLHELCGYGIIACVHFHLFSFPPTVRVLYVMLYCFILSRFFCVLLSSSQFAVGVFYVFFSSLILFPYTITVINHFVAVECTFVYRVEIHKFIVIRTTWLDVKRK